MKIVAFCPIKLNSQRLPGKNLKTLGSKPLLNHSIQTVLNSGCFDEVYVFCSDESIKAILPKGVKFLKRSTNLDSAATKGKEIYMSFAEKINADYYFLFHVTSPFLTLKTIEAALSSIKNGYDSAISVKSVSSFTWHLGLPVNFDPLDPIQTQLLNPVYVETSSFYLVAYKNIIAGFRYGQKVKFIEVSSKEAVDIDDESDWKEAIKLLVE